MAGHMSYKPDLVLEVLFVLNGSNSWPYERVAGILFCKFTPHNCDYVISHGQ